MLKKLSILVCLLVLFIGCQNSNDHEEASYGNPASEGFDAENSDSMAIAIADSVMKAMGGRKSWDQTNIISWNFFGNRTHTWNKQTGRDSISIPGQNLVIDMNMQSQEGTVIKNSQEITQSDSVEKYMQQGYQLWVNDSYWLLMPFKMKDSGVTLTYVGTDTMQTGMPAHKLKLTFNNVGVTPDNMYYVYVDTVDYLVRQWAYYPRADMDEPGFVLPWKDYKKHGDIMLSGNRGQRQISDIKVMDKWPETK